MTHKHEITLEAMLNSKENTLGDKLKNLSSNIKQILSLLKFYHTKTSASIHDTEVSSIL